MIPPGTNQHGLFLREAHFAPVIDATLQSADDGQCQGITSHDCMALSCIARAGQGAVHSGCEFCPCLGQPLHALPC